MEQATFAAGCFWGVEEAFAGIPGVTATRVGYTGGHTEHPTYHDVCTGMTGHAEAVEVSYDPARVSYAQLLEVFWRNIDPLAVNRQFCDVGRQYRSAIFFSNDSERRLALEFKAKLEKSRRWRIATEIVQAGPFYAAEEYHQSYYKKNPLRYKYYRAGCGRDARLRELWEEWR